MAASPLPWLPVIAAACVSYLTVYAGSLAVRRLDRRDRLVAAAVAAAGYASLLAARPESLFLSGAVVLAFAVAGGAVAAAKVRSVVGLATFCLAASAADLYLVSGGLERGVGALERAGLADLPAYLAVAVPSPAEPLAVVGVGDLVVVAALVQVLLGLGAGRRPAFVVPAGGLAAALGIGLLGMGQAGVPWISLVALAYVSAVYLRS